MLKSTRRKRSISERFWEKVSKNGQVPKHAKQLGRCWIWKASRFHYGHGLFSINQKPNGAHRVAWILENGKIPKGLCVLHKCDNPPCVNPAHLYVGTQVQNIMDRDVRLRTARGNKSGPRLHPESLKRGEENNKSKLTSEDVKAIRANVASGKSNGMKLAADYGISHSTIYRIIRRKIWAHI